MAGRLDGKVAVITGAAQGLGEATAKFFAREGARVCVTDLRENVHAVAAEIGDAAIALHHDVSDESRWKEVVAETQRAFGRVDILINNAGIVFMGGSILEIDRADFERMFNVNFYGSFFGIKQVAPAIIASGGGSIVNIASIAGLIGLNGISPYSASKWAVRGLSKTAAMELGPKGVRVNSVLPGTINTEMGNIGKETEEELNARHHRQPIQRVGHAQEIAHTLVFLASDESSYLAGAEIVVDGGQTTGIYTNMLPNGVD